MNRISRRLVLTGVSAAALCGLAPRKFAAASETPAEPHLPREVWVASVCQAGLSAESPKQMIDKVLGRMKQIVPMKPDIICLPEMFHVANTKQPRPSLADSSESPIGPISIRFADFAKQHQCYVICSISTVDAGRYYNSALVIDRQGKYVGEYRKINPTVGELELGFTPGPLDPPVFDLDFGKIGIQTCYDINWHDNWRRLRQKGAEIVFWPSAFAGGRMLNALAWINKYYVVSSTRIHDSKVVDVLGEDICSTGRFDDWVCTPLNLDVAVVQTHRNIDKLDAVREKYGRDIDIKVQHIEAWARIESRSARVAIKDVLREFGLETAEEMFARETTLQNSRRP